MLQVCITCLQEITDLNFISLGDATSMTGSLKVRDVLSICVPELTLDIITDPIMCAACMTSLHVAYDFRCKCLRTEEQIQNHIQGFTVGSNEVEILTFQETEQVNKSDLGIYTATNIGSMLPKIKTENSEWFEANQLEVWIKDEPQSPDEETTNKKQTNTIAADNQQEDATTNFVYSKLTNSWNEIDNKNSALEPHDTDSGWSSDLNSSGDPAEGQQLRKALEAPRKLYECDICTKTFDRSSSFYFHKKIHDDKPFKCKLCKYSATLRLNLIRHMREHIQAKPCTYVIV